MRMEHQRKAVTRICPHIGDCCPSHPAPPQVTLDAHNTKVSVLPALLNHLEASTGGAAAGFADGGVCGTPCANTCAHSHPLAADMAYVDPSSGFSEVRAWVWV